MLKIAVLVSGGGTNLQALLDAQARGEIQNGQIACVISSNPDAYALTRAKNAGIPGETLSRKDFPLRKLTITRCSISLTGIRRISLSWQDS